MSAFFSSADSTGAPATEGAVFAADEINRSGGVLGRKIELLIEDDQSRPDVSAALARKLVDQGAVFIMSISLSPARFMDPDASNPLLFQLAGRFDLITLWVTVLFAVGLYVTGRVTKGRAAVFGVLLWVVGALPALRQGYTMM